MISVPRAILWDYREAPEELLWRLQRIARPHRGVPPRPRGAGLRRTPLDLADILANKLLALTERSEPKDFVDLFCGVGAPGAPAIDTLVEDAERKFGVHGVRHMLRARFLAPVPSLGGLEMRVPFDPAAVGRFFRETAQRWVRESLDEGP